MKMRISERAAPVAAAVSALATLACCLPLGIAGAAGALGLSVILAPIRPWLIGLAIALLAFGSWQLLRGQRTCHRRSPVSLIVLAISAVIVLGILLFPHSVASLMAELPW